MDVTVERELMTDPAFVVSYVGNEFLPPGPDRDLNQQQPTSLRTTTVLERIPIGPPALQAKI